MSEVEKSVKGFESAAIDKLQEAHDRYGTRVDDVEIRFDLRGCTLAGQGGRDHRGWFIRINRQNLFYQWEDALYDTLPHEIAHVVCIRDGLDTGHGPVWKRICIELGGSGERCVHPDIHYLSVEGSWKYQGASGKVYWLRKKTHKSLQKHGITWTSACGDIIGPTNFVGYMRPNGQFKPTAAASVSVSAARSARGQCSDTDPIRSYVADRLKQRYRTGLDALFDLKVAAGIASEVGVMDKAQQEKLVKSVLVETFDDVKHLA